MPLRPAFALLALALVAACSAPAPAPAPTVSRAPAPSPSPLVAGALPGADPAVHVFLWDNPATTARDLALASAAGFTWVKQRFEWRNIEGRGRGQFEWLEPDRIVQSINASGLRLIARVDNQPRWAAAGIPWPGSGPPDDLADWTTYLTALASRYRGRIQAYEVWNEPNLAREWGNQHPDPAAYTRLLTLSYQAIKAADPAALVISAGLAPTTTDNAEATPDLAFLRGMYGAGLKGGVNYDLLGVNAPGYLAEPCADPAAVAANPALTNNDPSPPEARRVYAFRHVEDVRALMLQQGDTAQQMAIMEMGWTTDPRPDSEYAWFAVQPDQQAQNLVAAFQCARQRWLPWMTIMTVIYIPDPRWSTSQEQFWWSITKPDGGPRPAYTALKALFNP